VKSIWENVSAHAKFQIAEILSEIECIYFKCVCLSFGSSTIHMDWFHGHHLL